MIVMPCLDFCLVHSPCALRAQDADPGLDRVIEKLDAGLAYE